MGMPDYVNDDFEWDIDKSDDAYRRHGFDFEFARQVFEDPDYREKFEERDFGEERSLSCGRVAGFYLTVVWTQRGRRKRIISAFQSSREDIIDYEQAIGWSTAGTLQPSEDEGSEAWEWSV